MFASEHLLLHDSISTLELKNYNVRWYAKEALLTDRALYLYKKRSNYVHDAHQRLTLAKYRAQRPAIAASGAQQANSLPQPPEPGYEVLVEILPCKEDDAFQAQPERLKRKIIACQSEAKAESFVKLFNLVSAFTKFDQDLNEQNAREKDNYYANHDSLAEQQRLEHDEHYQGQFGRALYSKEDQKRIERWVQGSVIKHQEGKGETMTFANETMSQCSKVLQILTGFFKSEVTSLCFTNNTLTDSGLASLCVHLRNFQKLQKLRVTGNLITTSSLATLAGLFQHCQHITDVNLSNNRLGGGAQAGGGERDLVDCFLLKFFTELWQPRRLDLSYNSFTDECLYPVIKYIFANHECKLEHFNLENNRLSPFASRTVLKAYSISPNRASINFKFGPLPLSLENLRAGFITEQDQESIAVVAARGPLSDQSLDMSASRSRADSQNQTGDGQRPLKDSMVLTIMRKSNNFSGSGNSLKRAPVSRADREQMEKFFGQIESIIQKREEIEIEELREFVLEITSNEVEFEFPRYRLEPIFNVVNEKLEAAIEHENIYMLEVLLDCLKFMNATNIPAEKKYYELANEAQRIARQLLEVLNMEIKDDTAMQRLLVESLKRGKKIGLRGELIDAARHLYLLTEKVLGEMRGKAAAVSDDEDEAIYEVNEEDRPLNVYDARLDKHIDLKPEELGLTSEVELHLAAHPYSTDYLKLANLNLNYVKKNLLEAKKFLKDEENYAYRNIFERCSVLLSDAGEHSEASITYNLARNDQNLKLARLIFRYKNNLDILYPFKLELPPRSSVYIEQVQNQNFKEPDPQLADTVSSYPGLRSPDSLASPSSESSITNLLTARANQEAVKFHKQLVAVLKGGTKTHEASEQFYSSIQALFEGFIIQGVRAPGARKVGLLNSDLSDEFYLQLYQQVSLWRPIGSMAQKTGGQQYFNSLLILALLSNYIVPANVGLHQGLHHWLLQMRTQTGSEEHCRRIISRILNNFQWKEEDENLVNQSDQEQDAEGADGSEGRSSKSITPRKSTVNGAESRLENNRVGVLTWPPSKLEIDCLATGQPMAIKIRLTNGEQITQSVDETSTVESVLDQVRGSHPFFVKEPETETYWLFRELHGAESGQQAEAAAEQAPDFPIPKDKKILKLLYQAERQHIANGEPDPHESKQPAGRSRVDRRGGSYKTQQESDSHTTAWQKCHFVVRKRIFTSLYVFKNFKKLHKRSLEQVYGQLRSDHVDKCLLKESCDPDDVVYFGALILKVRLQSKILRSKQNKISPELILKHIDFAIPSCFIEQPGAQAANSDGSQRKAQHWAERIEEQYFRKKEFMDYSSEDAQEKFLSGIGLYNIMFSSYYVLRKDLSDKRESQRMSIMSHIAAQRHPGIGGLLTDGNSASSSDGESEVESADSARSSSSEGTMRKPGRRNYDSTIHEASSEDERSSGTSQRQDADKGSQDERRKRPQKTKLRTSAMGGDGSTGKSEGVSRKLQKKYSGASSFWAQLDDDELLLAISMQGVQILENSRRARIVYHIDLEDILYVMGKGSKLKIGFVQTQQIFDGRSSQASDFRTELYTSSLHGVKARVIAEDIIAYAQLRLAEMSKSDQVEFLNRNHVANLFDRLEKDHQQLDSQALDATDDDMGVRGNPNDPRHWTHHRRLQQGSFQGLQDLQISQADLLDSQDLEQEDADSFVGGLGQLRTGDRHKDLTPAGRYQRSIISQLGNGLKFKTDKFFAYSKRYPLYNGHPSQDVDLSRSRGETTSTSLKQQLQQANQEYRAGSQHKGDAQSSAEKRSEELSALNEESFSQQATRPRVGGSLSAKPKFDLQVDARNTIDEDQEEEGSSKDRASSRKSRHASQSEDEEKPQNATPPRDLADFLREANSFNRRGGVSPDGSADDGANEDFEHAVGAPSNPRVASGSYGSAVHAWTEGTPKSDRERAFTGMLDQCGAHQYTEGSGPSASRYEGGLSRTSIKTIPPQTVDFSRLEKKEDRAEQAANLFSQALLLAPPGVFIDDQEEEEKEGSDDEW